MGSDSIRVMPTGAAAPHSLDPRSQVLSLGIWETQEFLIGLF